MVACKEYLHKKLMNKIIMTQGEHDILLGRVEDLLCLPEFNNSPNGGDYRCRAAHDGMTTNYTK